MTILPLQALIWQGLTFAFLMKQFWEQIANALLAFVVSSSFKTDVNYRWKSHTYDISCYLRQTKAEIRAINSRIPMTAAEMGSAADRTPPFFGPSCISWTVLFLCSPQFLDPKTYLESRLTCLFWPTPYLRVHLPSLESDLKTKKLQPTARLHNLLQSSTVKTPK